MAISSSGAVARRRLGRTGVEVSMIGLGGYHLGDIKQEQDAIRLIRMAIDGGIDFMDNCWDYHAGKCEIWMGNALREGYRQRAFLMTKVDGRTRASAAGQLEQCLQRLQTDVIDLIQIHEVIRMSDADQVFAPGGAMEALVDAKRAGKVRFIGFTGHKDPSSMLHMLRVGLAQGFTFDAVQLPLNVMDAHYRSFEQEVLPVLLEHDIGVLGMKPLGAGVLLESKVVTARECLRYALSLPTSVVITGCESVDILEQAFDVAAGFHPLSDDERQALLSRTAVAAAAGIYEKFKTTTQHDGTIMNPHWLDTASLTPSRQ